MLIISGEVFLCNYEIFCIDRISDNVGGWGNFIVVYDNIFVIYELKFYGGMEVILKLNLLSKNFCV